MKKLLSVLLVAVLLIGALPIINGILMKKAVTDVFSNINEMYKDTGTDYSLEIINYNRSLFSSTIDWKINFGKLKTLYGIDEVVFTDTAKHGIMGVASTTSLDKNEWFTRFVNDKLGGENPFTLSTFYSLFGSIETSFTNDPFSMNIEQEIVSVEESDCLITTDKELKNFDSTCEWGGFEVSGKAKLGKMEFESDLEMLSTYLWNGTASFDIEAFGVTEANADFEATGITGQYNLAVDEDGNSMSAQSAFSVAAITTASTTIDGAKGTIAINGVDAIAYEEFMKQYMQVISEVMGSVTEMQDGEQVDKDIIEQQMTAAGLQMMAAYENLLQQDLEIHIQDLEIKLAEGDIIADVQLKLLQNMTLMQFAPVVGQPSLILDILYLKSNIQIPSSLVGENPMLFSPVFPGMQTGVFVNEGDKVIHSAETKDGALVLNGMEVDLNQLQQ